MSKYKSLIMDWEEKVHSIPQYIETIKSSEHIDEVKTFVFNALNLKYDIDKSHAIDIIEQDWHELWYEYNFSMGEVE